MKMKNAYTYPSIHRSSARCVCSDQYMLEIPIRVVQEMDTKWSYVIDVLFIAFLKHSRLFADLICTGTFSHTLTPKYLIFLCPRLRLVLGIAREQHSVERVCLL